MLVVIDPILQLNIEKQLGNEWIYYCLNRKKKRLLGRMLIR